MTRFEVLRRAVNAITCDVMAIVSVGSIVWGIDMVSRPAAMIALGGFGLAAAWRWASIR